MDLNAKTFGAGEPFVLLHGLFGMLDNWQTLAKRFAHNRMSVIVDLPNHGDSPRLSEHSYDAMTDAFADYLENQWMHRVDLLGHSMGGKVAMNYALQFPDRVNRLVVVDMGTKLYERGHDDIIKAMQGLPLDAKYSRKELNALLKKDIPNDGTRLFLMKNIKRKKEGGYRWKVNLDVVARDYNHILTDMADLNAVWEGEALFIRGGDSNYILDKDWDGIKQIFPNAVLKTVPNAGHWVHAQQPDLLYQLVDEFLQ